jgi:carbohydrate-binding DOMON domain-containing protein
MSKNNCNFDYSLLRLSIVLDGGNWSLTNVLGSGPALKIVIKREKCILYIHCFIPHPTTLDRYQASLWVPGWGIYKRNILGAGVGT